MLAAYDEQIRRRPTSGPGIMVDQGARTTRVRSTTDGWSGVTWSDLTPTDVDAAIAAEVETFAGAGRTWEWKYYSYDRPPALPERLRAHGLVPGEVEALMVADLADLDLSTGPPEGVDIRPVLDAAGVDVLVHVHDRAFGGDHRAMGRSLLADLGDRPVTVEAFVAYAGSTPVAAGRVEVHAGTDFASLWGGSTVPGWRGRGVFRSLVAHRAARARAQGFPYLQVDATPQSRPILRRLGFVELAETTPFTLVQHPQPT